MIPEFKKILYTTDLSDNARHAFGYAASLANRYGAAITFLHVIEDASPYSNSLLMNVVGYEKWEKLRKENETNVLTSIKERLEKFCEDVAAELPACPFITDDIVVRVGNPVDEILALAEAVDADLIVMGAHGLGIMAGAVIGSTSRRVLRRCERPVLVIRLPE